MIDDLPTSGLDSSQRYTGSIVALSEHNIAAGSPAVAVVSALPQLSYASYDGTKVVVGWTPVGGQNDAVTEYLIEVTSPQDDTHYKVFIPNRAATGGVLTLPRMLSADQAYVLSLAAVTADGVQGRTATLPIITARPQLLQVGYNGQQIEFVWEASLSPAVTGYTLKVISLSSGTTYTNTISNPQATRGSVAAPSGELDAAQTFVAEVWAEGPVAGVSNTFRLVVARPTLNTVRYDGKTIEADLDTGIKSSRHILRTHCAPALRRATLNAR